MRSPVENKSASYLWSFFVSSPECRRQDKSLLRISADPIWRGPQGIYRDTPHRIKKKQEYNGTRVLNALMYFDELARVLHLRSMHRAAQWNLEIQIRKLELKSFSLTLLRSPAHLRSFLLIRHNCLLSFFYLARWFVCLKRDYPDYFKSKSI
jgi:hypothetical protein